MLLNCAVLMRQKNVFFSVDPRAGLFIDFLCALVPVHERSFGSVSVIVMSTAPAILPRPHVGLLKSCHIRYQRRSERGEALCCCLPHRLCGGLFTMRRAPG